MTDVSRDDELEAIRQLVIALEPLDHDAQQRVIQYVFQRLGLSELPAVPEQAISARSVVPEQVSPIREFPERKGESQFVQDVRSFAEQKGPKSIPERVAVVAYYIQELAPESDRKSEIAVSDIDKYFKQANLPLPPTSRRALFDARNAGYVDSTGHGKYALNPVGYNLVAHSLPREGGAAPRSTRRNPKKGRKRAASNTTGTRKAKKKKKSSRKSKPRTKSSALSQ